MTDHLRTVHVQLPHQTSETNDQAQLSKAAADSVTDNETGGILPGELAHRRIQRHHQLGQIGPHGKHHHTHKKIRYAMVMGNQGGVVQDDLVPQTMAPSPSSSSASGAVNVTDSDHGRNQIGEDQARS